MDAAPELRRIVVAVDPPASGAADAPTRAASSRRGWRRTGAIVVLADATVQRGAAARLGRRGGGAAVTRLEADCLVAEVNQGGDMVKAVIAQVDAGVPVTAVRATRGKWLRAEPVAALYEQGRVRHAGELPALEDEMCGFGAGRAGGRPSPDRVDALVWALTELLPGRGGVPRIRDFV